jgi:hypothetical protein
MAISPILLGSRYFPSRNSTGFTQVLSRQGTTNIIMPDEKIPEKREKTPSNPHEKGVQTFARYFANEPAQGEIYKAAPKFPAGSIIVREKLLSAEDAQPELVTAMIKREKGFSPKTGDWEYVVVEGGLNKISRREKTGSCSNCHAGAADTDFVFKTYLK